jgi:hypothetical protein
MGWDWDLTDERSVAAPSLVDRRTASDASSAFLAPLEDPEAPLR